MEKVRKTTEKVKELGESMGGESGAREVKVMNSGSDLVGLMIGTTRAALGGALLTLLILYFLLGWGAPVFRNLVRAQPGIHGKRRLLSIAKAVQDSVGAYFTIVTLINIGFGLVVGVAMSFFVLWGAIGALFAVPFLVLARVMFESFGGTRGFGRAMGK